MGSFWGWVESHQDQPGSHRDHGGGRGWGSFLDFCLPSPVVNCSITWAVFVAGDYNLLMLVEIVGPTSSKYFQVVSYDLGNWGTTGGC